MGAHASFLLSCPTHPHHGFSAPPSLCAADWVIDNTFELFMDLGATDEQCDFPVIYASGFNGIAGTKPNELAPDLEPLFQVGGRVGGCCHALSCPR